MATILMIFLRVLPKICCGPTTRGPQELGSPASLNRLNRSYATGNGLNFKFDKVV